MSKKNEMFEALSLLENEKGIPVEFMIDKISKAIITACKNSYNGNDEAIIDINLEKALFDVRLMKTVVEEVSDNGREISIQSAKDIDKNVSIGDKVPVKLDTKEFGRIAAQTARNIIRQGIRDGEREQILKDFKDKYHEIVTATIEKIDDKTGNATIKIGKAETVLPKGEQLPGDIIKENDIIKVYIVDVRETERGPKIIVSRTHPDFIRKLFELEVPEIQKGIVEIKNIVRDAGIRTKIVVDSKNPDVDASGSCIGTKGCRVLSVVEELKGEKIDVISYTEDVIELIKAALAPANVFFISVSETEEKLCSVVVEDDQLSMAIGNKGQNVRLAARISGFKIDIKPISAYSEEEIENMKRINEERESLLGANNEEEEFSDDSMVDQDSKDSNIEVELEESI